MRLLRSSLVGGSAPKPPGFFRFFQARISILVSVEGDRLGLSPAIPATEPVARVASQCPAAMAGKAVKELCGTIELPKPTGSRPSSALVLQRARFSSVAPGCVVKTVVTEVCIDRLRSRLGDCLIFHDPDGRLSAESVEGRCHVRPRTRRQPLFCQYCIQMRPGWISEQPRSM